MPSKGILIINSSLVGSSNTTPFTWVGGRSVLTIAATSFGAGVDLQAQLTGGKWIPICSSFIANQSFPFDAFPGQYQLACGSGIATFLAVSLSSVPYN